jgi:predicted LPLAT superfamily acyltransferase
VKLSWRDAAEVGTTWGIRFVLIWLRVFGRTGAQLLLRALVLYYALTQRTARRASQEYHRRLGLASGFAATYRHLLRFAECVLDRVLFLSGRWQGLILEHHGLEHLQALRAERKGALLLGAHFGSFEALRAHAIFEGLTVNVVADFGNSARITTFLNQLGPNTGVNFIGAEQAATSLALTLRDAIARGEIVALLADRPNQGRQASAQFLGAPAQFPTGPYALAAVLRCPIYLTFGIYTAPNRYDLYCEPFAETVTLPREQRDAALAQFAQRYADRLAERCRLAPDNWFNFYDFWTTPEPAVEPSSPTPEP